MQKYKLDMDKQLVFNYMIALRGYFLQVVKPNTSVECIGYTYSGGGLVKIELNDDSRNSVDLIERSMQYEVFHELDLKQYLGTDKYGRFHFSGTNIIDDGDKIIFIKDDMEKEWSEEAAKKDILFLLNKEHHD